MAVVLPSADLANATASGADRITFLWGFDAKKALEKGESKCCFHVGV